MYFPVPCPKPCGRKSVVLIAKPQILAGAEGFEPPSPVLETGSLTVELTPLNSLSNCRIFNLSNSAIRKSVNFDNHLTSLCGVCFRQRRQNFFSSRRSGVVFRFFVVE